MSARSTHVFDAIVIGGGHNGLVAAFYLARAGRRVVVLERRAMVGGPAATVEHFPGFRCSFTNSPGSLEPKIVRDMELERYGLSWLKPDPAVVMPFDDGRFFVGWRDQARMRENIAHQFSARDASAYGEVFEFFNDFARRLKVSIFEAPPTFAELAARMRTVRDQADFATVFFGSIRDFLDRRLETDAMKTSIASLSPGGAVAPSLPGTPAALLNRPIALYSSVAAGAHDPRNQPLRGSTGLPVGGMGAIVEAMRAALEKLGVVIRTQAAVAGLDVDSGGAARGAHLADGEEFRAPLVVSNLHPRTTFLTLPPRGSMPEEVRGQAEALPKGAACFKLVLALDEPPLFGDAPADLAQAYSSCQIRIAPSLDYLEQCHQDYLARRSTLCPRLALLTPTFNDPTLAPEGMHLMSVNSWFFPPDLAQGDWRSERDVMGARIFKMLADRIPSLQRSVVAMKCYSPLDIEEELGLIGGNFSHLDMTPALMFGNRPFPGMANYRTPIRGYYLCGAGAWPGGTVTGAPGHNAAHAALEDTKDWTPV